jgi:hypothetical protein
MSVNQLIARGGVPVDTSGTRGEIARMQQADQYRNQLMQREDAQLSREQAQQAQEDAEDDHVAGLLQSGRYDEALAIDPENTQLFMQAKGIDPQSVFRNKQLAQGQSQFDAQQAAAQRNSDRSYQVQMAQERRMASQGGGAAESFSPFTQADGTVVLLGNRGSQRPTQLRGARPANAQTDKATANATSWDVYQAGMKGIKTGMEGSATGPIAGRIPAYTAAQQSAEGAVSAMAPVLKQLFRSAGEGVFTDKDQELLIAMMPTRKDHTEARKFKLDNIDSIVRAKLGMEGAAPTQQAGEPVRVASPQEAAALPVGAEFITPDGQKRVRK